MRKLTGLLAKVGIYYTLNLRRHLPVPNYSFKEFAIIEIKAGAIHCGQNIIFCKSENSFMERDQYAKILSSALLAKAHCRRDPLPMVFSQRNEER